ncbi:hypothetical protein Droror1_Dr00027700 [Drosera rotundifolia]
MIQPNISSASSLGLFAVSKIPAMTESRVYSAIALATPHFKSPFPSTGEMVMLAGDVPSLHSALPEIRHLLSFNAFVSVLSLEMQAGKSKIRPWKQSRLSCRPRTRIIPSARWEIRSPRS